MIGTFTLSLTLKEALDGWNKTFTTGDASYISNIVTDDLVFRPTYENENLEQVSVGDLPIDHSPWSIDQSSLMG